MVKRTFVGRLAVWIAIAFFMAITTTRAATISDIMTVYDPAGNIFAQAIAYEGQELPIVTLPQVPIDLNQFGNPTQLVLPGTTPGTFVASDIFGVANLGPGNYVLAFTSLEDNAPAGPPPPIGIVLVEIPGVPVSATMYLSLDLQAQGYTATFVSGLDVATPLPATLPLFATGLGMMGLLGWRRKRKRAEAAA